MAAPATRLPAATLFCDRTRRTVPGTRAICYPPPPTDGNALAALPRACCKSACLRIPRSTRERRRHKGPDSETIGDTNINKFPRTETCLTTNGELTSSLGRSGIPGASRVRTAAASSASTVMTASRASTGRLPVHWCRTWSCGERSMNSFSKRDRVVPAPCRVLRKNLPSASCRPQRRPSMPRCDRERRPEPRLHVEYLPLPLP